MRRRRKRHILRASSFIDEVVGAVSKLVRFTFFGKKSQGGGDGAPPSELDRRWITHEFWEPEFYVDVFFVIALFPFFLRDYTIKRKAKARLLREQRHQHRVTRYRASAGNANRRQRR